MKCKESMKIKDTLLQPFGFFQKKRVKKKEHEMAWMSKKNETLFQPFGRRNSCQNKAKFLSSINMKYRSLFFNYLCS